jgi:Flp pilus assembly protein TadG
MAFLLPILLVLLAGAYDFGRAYYLRIEVTNAARAGAQYGCQSTATATDTTGIKNAANADAYDVPLASGSTSALTFPTVPTITCQCVPNTGGAGTTASCTSPGCTSGTNHFVEWLTVYTQYTYTPLIPWNWASFGMNFSIPATIQLNGQATMRIASVD